jgi:hypothetical protein
MELEGGYIYEITLGMGFPAASCTTNGRLLGASKNVDTHGRMTGKNACHGQGKMLALTTGIEPCRLSVCHTSQRQTVHVVCAFFSGLNHNEHGSEKH